MLYKEITEEIMNRTVDQYLEFLDPSKTTLLKADAERIKKELRPIFSTMQFGNCTQLDRIQKIVIDRSVENENFVRSFLGANYSLDESTVLVLDPKKREFAKNATEKQELLKKMVHFQIQNYLLTDLKLPEAKSRLVHRYELITKRVREQTGEKLLVQFTDAFTAALDPHSQYTTPERLEEFKIDMGLQLDGIGAQLSYQDGYTVVEELVPGGAADRARVLQRKDKIIAVGQGDSGPWQSVIDMDLRDVVRLIRGKRGTKVRLSVLRQGTSTERVEVSIVRDRVKLEDAAAKLTFEKRNIPGRQTPANIAIIDLPGFYGSDESKVTAYDDVKRLLMEARKNKADGVVLNLSRNGGGLLQDAVRISGLFINRGAIVGTQNSEKEVNILEDDDSGALWTGPLVVLTSRGSASASEILAGALKDYKRALIVGADHTFGKGTVQAVIPLPRQLGAVKTTIQMFFLPGGVSTQHEGVASHIVLPNALNSDEFGEKSMDNSLPSMRIQPFLGASANFSDTDKRWIPISDSLVKSLAEKSKQRVVKDPKFIEIKKEIEELNQNRGVVRLADIKTKASKNREKIKREENQTAAERQKEREAPYIQEAANIVADWIAASGTASAR